MGRDDLLYEMLICVEFDYICSRVFVIFLVDKKMF